MRASPLYNLKQGINRLRVKGGANPSQLYDLVNAYIQADGSIVPREGTIRAETLNSQTVGLCAVDGVFNVFATSLVSVPSGYQCNVLINPANSADTLEKIWFAQPFMGFLFVVAEFTSGDINHYWLQNNGTWTANTVYKTDNIVLPDVANGLAYEAVRDMPQNPLWTAQTLIAQGDIIEPNTYTGYCYRAITVSGTNPHTSSSEPVWPTTEGALIQEFGDFDLSPSDSGTFSTTSASGPMSLGTNITDRYGDSSDIAGIGTVSSSTTALPTAATKVTTWAAGTLYATGAVVQPSANQGAFTDAIPNGDFESGNDGNWTLSGTPGQVNSVDFLDASGLQYQGEWCLVFRVQGTQQSAVMFNYGTVTAGQSVTGYCYLNPDNSGANLSMFLGLNWYDDTDSFISTTNGAIQQGGGYRKASVTGVAPANAAHVRLAIFAGNGTGTEHDGYADLASWNLEVPSAVSNFLYEAVQASPAVSGGSQPTWPTVAGETVVDGGVTWEAVGTSIITWEAIPIMLSGATEPAFPTSIGNTVVDPSTYGGISIDLAPATANNVDSMPFDGYITASGIADWPSGLHFPAVVAPLGSVSGSLTFGSPQAFVYASATGVVYIVFMATGIGAAPAKTVFSSIEYTSPSTGNPITLEASAATYSSSSFTGIWYWSGDDSMTASSSGYVVNFEGVAGVTPINTSMSWQAVSREISDPNDPDTNVVCLGASHIFAGDNDIVPYSAAVNPTDWTSANNAGYLPTGLNNYGANPVKVLALYRSNLIALNAGGYQMWQIDPDPANMALLDAQPVGSIYTRAAQSVANDLMFLTEVGVRNLGTIGATANMQIGQSGQPIDPLVKAQLIAGTYDPISLYYPGRGQYWLFFGPQAYVFTINGQGLRTWSRYIFPDVITDWTLNAGVLYLRSAGNLVWQLDQSTLVDDYHTISSTSSSSVVFDGWIQWPYVDQGALGVHKMLVGIDLAGAGDVYVQIGFNQGDPTSFSDNASFASSTGVTAPYLVSVAETFYGEPIPIPCVAPSFSPILHFPGNQAWSFQAANLYIQDFQGGGAY
jgi:hypothetical protein